MAKPSRSGRRQRFRSTQKSLRHTSGSRCSVLLRVSHLEVCYGVISALQNVSVEIDRGEIVTLIGANGAGKTTLLRTISGLVKPARGSILYNDLQLTHLPPHEIVRAGVS